MKVVIKKAGKKPEIAEIENELSVLQEIVGGYIEILPLFGNIVLVCNEEGKLMGLPANFIFRGDMIVGDVFFCVAGKEDFESLDEAQASFLMSAMTPILKKK